MTLLWILIFIVSIALLVKSSDWLLESSERIGLAFGLSPFVVGILIVGLGTSFPEIIASIASVIKGVTTLVVANAVGSNITNILLIIGVSAIVGKRLTVTKNLIDLDLPLLAVTTGIVGVIIYDGQVILLESLLLLVSFGVYFAYTVLYKDDEDADYEDVGDILPSREERRKHLTGRKRGFIANYKNIAPKDFLLFTVGVIGLVIGAKYLIDSVIALSEIFNIIPGVITISAVALGTSLPELLVSVRAALHKRSEVALGNIFGSNVFNALVVIGIPGLFSTLEVDTETITIGLPFLVLATLLFVISGISKRIHIWEGLMYVLLYVLFIFTLFNIV